MGHAQHCTEKSLFRAQKQPFKVATIVPFLQMWTQAQKNGSSPTNQAFQLRPGVLTTSASANPTLLLQLPAWFSPANTGPTG